MLADFNPAEPDPSLFRIPPEYKVVDETATFTITLSPAPGRGDAVASFPVGIRVQGPNFRGSFSLLSNLAVVKDAPYSGREDLVQDRTLADGTHLHQDQGGNKVWRDSAGRVRTEYTGRGGDWTVAEIADPAGYGYVLDPWNRIVHRFPLHAFEANGPTRPFGGRPGSNTVDEKLGTQTMSGVEVTGRRAITTGPGPMQNTTADEVWEYAPYGLALLTKESRPNGVVRTTTIEDFSPKEPDPSLFRIPEGYRIVDETGTITITIPDPAK